MKSADYIRPHPHISVGHKGLFAERLDVPLMYAFGDPAHPTLTPFSRIHYHTRNRVLDPTLGRWLQRDPNATGQTVVDATRRHGWQPSWSLGAVILESHLADGLNSHAHVQSNPVNRSDPSGLFSYGEIGSAMNIGMDIYMDYTQESMSAGHTAGMVGRSLFQTQAIAQMTDLFWALDWELPDDMHSRLSNYEYDKGNAEGLSLVMGGDHGPAMAGLGRIAGRHWHHIISNKNKKYMSIYAKLMDDLRIPRTAFMDMLESKDFRHNLMSVPAGKHIGRHKNVYHDWVLEQVKDAAQGLSGEQALYAIKNRLSQVREQIIKSNFDFIKNPPPVKTLP